MTGKMLACSGHACCLHTAHQLSGQCDDDLWILMKAAIANHLADTVTIQHGCKAHIDTDGQYLSCHQIPTIISRAERCAWIFGKQLTKLTHRW